MIRLSFTFNREPMNFVVHNREIFYTDRIWKGWIRCVPRDENLIRKVTLSRNKIPSQLLRMFTLSEKEKEEYNLAENDNAMADIIIKDAKNKGLKFEWRKDETMSKM